MVTNAFRSPDTQSRPAGSQYWPVLFAMFVGAAVGLMKECWDQIQIISWYGVEQYQAAFGSIAPKDFSELLVANVLICGLFGGVAGLLARPFLNRRKSSDA